MRILLIHTFHHPRGGDSTYALGLGRLLEGAGHAVAWLSMEHPENLPSPWARYWLPRVDRAAPGSLREARGLWWSAEAARRCAAIVADFRPDVAHLHHVHRHLTPSVLGPLAEAGVPAVWTAHDYELICPSGRLFAGGAPCERCKAGYRHAILARCKGDLARSALVAAEKALHRRLGVWDHAARFVAPSRFLAAKLREFGVPPEKVLHLPNFAAAAPAAEGPGEGWLVAGRLSEEKGLDVALAAARRLPGVKLRIAGDGPLAGELRRAPGVEFLGRLSPDGVAAAIRAAAVVAVPSRWYENFPYAVLEAQAAGRPVVASEIGGIPEQIEHGKTGLLVPAGDPAALAAAVGGLLADPGRAKELGAAGRAAAQRLDPASHLRALEALYEELLNQDPPRNRGSV